MSGPAPLPKRGRTREARLTEREAPALLRFRGARRRRCCWLRVEQDKSGRGEVRGDGRSARLRVLRLDVNVADVDDARELADALEERAQVVIVAFELQPDR